MVATRKEGEELQPRPEARPVDVLLLDINLPTSLENNNPFPILSAIPRLLHQFPALNILVITLLNQHSLIEALADAGVSGYILKDDQGSIQELGKIVIWSPVGAFSSVRALPRSAHRYKRVGSAPSSVGDLVIMCLLSG